MKNMYRNCKKYIGFQRKPLFFLTLFYFIFLLPAFLPHSSSFFLSVLSNLYLLFIHCMFVYIIHRLFEIYPGCDEKIDFGKIFGLFKENEMYTYVVPVSFIGFLFLSFSSVLSNILASKSGLAGLASEEEISSYMSSLAQGGMAREIGIIAGAYGIILLSAWFFDIYATEYYYTDEKGMGKKSGKSLLGLWRNLWDYTKVTVRFIPWFIVLLLTFGLAGFYVFPLFRLCLAEVAKGKMYGGNTGEMNNKRDPGKKAGRKERTPEESGSIIEL